MSKVEKQSRRSFVKFLNEVNFEIFLPYHK